MPALGFLPYSLMSHYGNPDFEATDENLAFLTEGAGDTEVLTLRESEWKEIHFDILKT